ncbi:phosphotransferase [Paenibacillus artemisiicola]|nr:phosphotransferase [Paenibacillus artemisiicola]
MELILNYLGSIEFPLGTPKTLIKMSSGFSNYNYLLTTSLGKYRIRVSQYSSHVDELKAEQMILKWAAEKNDLIVPMLGLARLPNGTDYSLFPYLDADPAFDINNEKLMRDAGRALAKYHLSVDGYRDKLPWKPLNETFSNETIHVEELRTIVDKQTLSEYPGFWDSVENLLQRMKNAEKFLNQEPYSLLPHLPCHGDFAPANLLTLGENVAGIIDFECCRWAPRLYDLTTFLLSLQQSEGYEAVMSSWFIEGYQSIIPLSQIELILIPVLQNIPSLESANRHLKRVIRGDQKLHAGLVMYWERSTINF